MTSSNPPDRYTAAEMSTVEPPWVGSWAVTGHFLHGHQLMPLIPRGDAVAAAKRLNAALTREEQRALWPVIRAELREKYGEVRAFVEYPEAARRAR